MTHSDTVEPTYHQLPAHRGKVLSRLSSPLDIRRLTGTGLAGEAIIGFFILNSSHTTLRVNGMRCDPTSLVGPLPEFAVIEIGEAAVFWWHSAEGVDYRPEYVDEVWPLIGANKRSANETFKHNVLGKHLLDVDVDFTDIFQGRPSKRPKLDEGKQ